MVFYCDAEAPEKLSEMKYYVPKKNSNQEPVITSTWMLAFVNETSLENVARFRELEASMFQELKYSCEIDQKQYFFQFKPKIDKADHAAARHS